MNTRDGVYVLAGEITDKVDGWVTWFNGTVRVVFLAVVIGMGIWLLVSSKGNFRKAIVFALSAAFVWFLLTRIGSVAALFGDEILG